MTRDVFWVERFGRLLRFGRQVALRQYAEKRIRCAMAILEVAGRQVERIRHIDYFILPFDAKGRIDKGEWTRGVRLALEIDARHRFIQRRYDHKFKWKLTRKMEEEIVAAMLDLR
jgi:hypothetical protein